MIRSINVKGAGQGVIFAEDHRPDSAPPPGMPTLVMCHGWALTHESWDPVIEAVLAKRTVRIVTYDQRGHGRSSMGLVKASIRQLGDDLQAVIQETVKSGEIILAGHSMGGMTIMGYAGLHHYDFRKRVRGVMLCATAGTIEGREPIPLEGLVMKIASRAPRIAPRHLVPQWAQGGLIFGDDPDPAYVRAAVRQIQHTAMPTIGQYFDALNQHDEVYALAHFVDVPTHIFVGSKDRLTPVLNAERLKNELPHADLTVLQGKGHMLTYEATEVIADAIVSLLDRAVAEA